MNFDTLWAKKFETDLFCTKISNRLLLMLKTRDIIFKIGFHIFDIESFIHIIDKMKQR